MKETHSFLHGELVAFGTLASLFLTNKPKDTIEKTYTFCESIGLPTILADIGLDNVSDEDILAVAKSTCVNDMIYNEPSPISASLVSAAIKKADLIGRKRKNLITQQ